MRTHAANLRAGRLALAAALVIAAATTAHAGDPNDWTVPANERDPVRLVTGGPRGCGMVPSGVPAGQTAQVFHVPWQEAGLNGWRPDLWTIDNRPAGARPLTVMDHTILVIYGPDGRTPTMIAEFLPDAEGNWQRHAPGSPKFEKYAADVAANRLIPGPTGTTNGNPVGAVYGLGDHCCTNTANAQINGGRGGTPARGLNWIGYQMNRCGATPFIRDNLGRCADTYRYCNMRFGPTIARAGTCGPDMINNGMVMGQHGFTLGDSTAGLFTDDPYVRGGAGTTGAVWFGTMGAELGYFTNTGQMLLPARYSPSYYTGRAAQTCVRGGGRLLVQGGRAAATNPLTIVVAGGVYLNYEANNYRVAVNDLVAMDDLSGISPEEFEAMIPYNVVSGAYWRNVGAFYGLCDPLPPPRANFRARPRVAACGGNVAAPNVDPPYEEGADDLGGCAAGRRGGAGGGALIAIGVALLALRPRRAREPRPDARRRGASSRRRRGGAR